MLSSLFSISSVAMIQLISLFIDYGLMIAAYVFKCIALYTMAKKQNLNNKWMCFVPFLNFIIIGKLIGKAVVWGIQVKNIGLIVCILSFVSFIFSLAYSFRTFANLFLNVAEGQSVTFSNGFLNFLYNVNSTSKVINIVLYYLKFFIDLAEIVFEVSMVFMIFRKYNPRRAMLFSILSIFFESLFGIFLFVSRNNDPVDYSAYRVYQRTYYGGYPGNDNGANGRRSNGAQNNAADSDPFPEFDDKKSFSGGAQSNNSSVGGANGSQNGQSGDENDDLFN